MNEIYINEGQLYEVAPDRKQEFLSKFPNAKLQEKEEEEEEVKTPTTTSGADVVEEIAPDLELTSVDTSLELPPVEPITSVKTGTVADTTIKKERDLIREQDIVNEYNNIEKEIIFNNPDYTPEEIKANVDKKQRLLLEDVDTFDKDILLNSAVNVINDVDKRMQLDISQATDNINAMQTLKNQRQQSIDNGVPYSNEEELKYVNFYNTLATQTQNLQQNIIKDAAIIEDKNKFIDTFKRSYSEIDRLENALLSAGTDIALGALLTLDMAKDEEGKEKSISKDLLSYREELARISEEDLGKAIAVENISDPQDALRWAADGLINFVSSGIMAFSGPAAMPLFFASGYGGRLSEFELANKKAEEVIPKLEAQLKETQDPLLKQKILEEIEFHNKALSTTDMKKFLTSTLYGGYEVGTEWLTTLQLVKGLKGLNGSKALETFYKEAGQASFGKALVNTIKDPKVLKTIGLGTLSAPIEGGGEGLNKLLGNITDITLNDANISMLDGVNEAYWNGSLIGTGFSLARGGQIARAGMMDVIADKQTKIELNKLYDEIQNLTSDLKQTTDSKVRKQLYDVIRKKIKESNTVQDYSASAFIKLDPKKQKEVFELDRKATNINNRWLEIAKSNASEATKTQLKKDLLEQFNSLQGQKRTILNNSNSLKLKNLELPEGLVQGDVVRDLKRTQNNLLSVEQNNKKTKYLNKQITFANNDLENINNFINSSETTLTLESGSVINKEDASEIINIIAENADGGFNKNNKNSYIHLEMAVSGNPSAPIHEYFHAMGKDNGFTKDQYDNIKDDFLDLLKTKLKNKEITKDQHDTIKKRFKLYDGSPAQSEELLAITGDAINLDILSEDDITFLQKSAYNIKKFVAGLIGKEESENFGIDTAEDAFSLLQSFQRSIVKNQDINIRANVLEPTEQQTDDTTVLSRSTLFEEINKLVPDNIKTKTEFDSFVRSPAGAKLFNAIYNEGGAINNYIRQRATTIEESQKIIDNTIERVLNFNPESTRDDGSAVGIEGFTERVMADTRFAKLDAKKDLFKESEKAKQEQQLDSPQAAQVTAEESATTETTKEQTSKLRRDLGIKQGDDLYNAVKQTAKEIFGKDLDNVELKKLKAIVNKKARGSELFKDVAKLMGTEKAIDPQFLNKNILNILKDLPVSDLVKLERGTKGEKIFTKTGPRLGPIAAREAVNKGLLPKNTNINSGPRVSEKLPVTLEQAKEFFTQKRKAGLVGVIAENLVADAAPSVTKEIKTSPKRRAEVLDVINRDPELLFSRSEYSNLTNKQKNDAIELIELIEKKEITDFYDGKGNLLPEYKKYNSVSNIVYELFNEPGGLETSEAKRFKSAVKNSKIIPDEIKKKFEEQGVFRFNKKYKDLLAKDAETISKELGENIMKVLDYDIFGFYNRALDPAKLKQTGKPGEYFQYKENIKKSVKGKKSNIPLNVLSNVRKMNKAFPLFKKIDKIFKLNASKEVKLKELQKLKPEIEAANKANIQLANEILKTVNRLYREGKISGVSALNILQLQTNATGGLRALSTLDFVTLEDGPQTYKTKGEHLAPNSNTMFELAEAVLDPKLTLEEANNIIEGAFLEHSQWYTSDNLTQIVDKRGGKNNTSNANRIKFLDNKDVSNVFNIDGRSYRVNEIIEKSQQQAAKPNNNMLPIKDRLKGDFTNQMVLDKMAEVDNVNKEEALQFSKSEDLSKQFNDIIENKTGIGTDKRYAKVKARVAGAGKGKFNFFVPPSAEDFVGLLYETLGKGKTGDAQMAWYKVNLLDPYARAMNDLNRDRLTLLNDYKALKKDLKIVPKNLRKKIPGEPFTREQAVRVYIWDQQGMSIPGLSQTDLKELTKYVNDNADLKIFGDQLLGINKGDPYNAPKNEGWTAGDISSDLLEGLRTTKRAKYLELWQQNVDQIFSETNLNKLEAAFGEGYRGALENMLYRMKTGRNRTFGKDGLMNRATDWLTNSVGAIMFFNTRSAILQTISSINFINWSDNNILAAGKALANIPQYKKDFVKLMNSPFLLARRDGLKMNVNEADIADMAKDPGSMARRFIAKTLRLGFLPTQIADSFAIASGGATFYRNRIKKYVKDGMSEQAAEKQAMIDFTEIAETSQQSSRPDKISQQQAGGLGRVILAFANTPMQYTREIKKAASDLKNGRGDAKTNISKIIYYGFVQNLIFNALQQALFALMFDDEEELTKKELEKKETKDQKRYLRILNSMSDQFLRGIGVGGAIVSTLKNTTIKLLEKSKEKEPEYAKNAIIELAQVSPPLGSKFRKLNNAGNAFEWNKDEMKATGWSLDNPAYLAGANVISAMTNLPADRVVKKIDNLRNASNTDLQTYKRIASFGGWSRWDLDIPAPELPKGETKKRRGRRRRKGSGGTF